MGSIACLEVTLRKEESDGKERTGTLSTCDRTSGICLPPRAPPPRRHMGRHGGAQGDLLRDIPHGAARYGDGGTRDGDGGGGWDGGTGGLEETAAEGPSVAADGPAGEVSEAEVGGAAEGVNGWSTNGLIYYSAICAFAMLAILLPLAFSLRRAFSPRGTRCS